MRHRGTLQDLALVAAAVLVATYIAYDVDLFMKEAATAGEKMIRSEELAFIGAVLSFSLLLFAWHRSVGQKREIARRIAAEREARAIALQDPLTGLPNRRRFNDALKAAVTAPPRLGGAHALLTLDLNGFKHVNDVYGHGAGDEVLVVVSQRLLSVLRDGDLVARLGGDEFAILAHHLAGPEGATSIALRISEALGAPILTGGVAHEISAGIGICLFPFEGATEGEVMRRGDVALYRAKGECKACARFFDEDMDRHVREREHLERELRIAIAADQVTPFFQPLVDLKTKEVVAFEALARWTHPKLGNIPPDRFIPIAEDSGLIQALTDKLLRSACEVARTWPSHVRLAFNISPVQLKDRTLSLRILKILGETGLLPHRLELEITESALVRDLEAAQTALGTLRDAGVQIALDDFGTGYSSLFHLRNFKVDKIKIDRSFIAGMGSEKESAEIVNALIGLGRGLGITITAEGVEDGEQQAALAARGCDEAQGYMFSAAVRPEDTGMFFAHPPELRAAS